MTLRTDPTSKPTLSICLIVRNAASTLETALRSARERAPGAEIVVVDTMSSDNGESERIAKKYADVWVEYKGPAGTWSREMYAFDDAAAARNESFRLATGKWVMWLDADDELPAPAEAERLLTLNGRWKPAGRLGQQNDKVVGLEEFLDGLDRDEKCAELQGFWAPYLYRFGDQEGRAMTWQTRERIVRNNGEWHWQRKAHEVLVPKNPKMHAKLGTLAHLLFVHRKEFSEGDVLYSLQRHNAILLADYERGVRNCQDILYLENYSIFLAPEKRTEYIEAALNCAFTPVDRARCLLRKGNYAREQGFFHDAVEAFAAAAQVCPDFPDSHFALAETYDKADQCVLATDWFEKATAISTGHPFSDIPPREHAIAGRIKGALAAMKASKLALSVGNLDVADSYANRAVKLAAAAYNEPFIGPDRVEAAQWLGLFENERNGLQVVRKLHGLWDYLVKNDENDKARLLLKSVPHNMLDHPAVVEIERWAKKLDTHFTDTAAYKDFYESIGTDIQSNADESHVTLPRADFAVAQLRETFGDKPFSLLEVGPFDGITAIPLMRAFPHMSFTGLEIKESAVKSLTERIVRLQLPNKARVLHGQLADAPKLLGEEQFDAVIFYEVIEHVPSPEGAIGLLANHVRPQGLLFVSTPWGAFDRGHQPAADTRDQRGHVRAMMPHELVDAIESTRLFAVETQGGSHGEANYGDTIHLVARRLSSLDSIGVARRPVSFAVAAALWDWNASHVISTGIGASEETIVFLSRALAQDGLGVNDVRVFGPLPKAYALPVEEVNGGVKYLSNAQVRRINPDGPVVVSRAPSYGLTLDKEVGEPLEKYLWLQDAYYPDLDAKVAARYEKVVVLSQWHKWAMSEFCGVPKEKMVVIPNFLLREHFDVAAGAKPVAREPHRFIYASSPDRGLIRLLKIWPHIIKEWPDAKLGIFYGWDGCMKLSGNDAGWNARYRALRTEYLSLCKQPGIEEYGRVNHERIALEMRRAAVWPYPTDFDETFCSNALKARAAGCVPVCSPRAALNESAKCDQTLYVPEEQKGETFGDYAWRFFTEVKKAVTISDEARATMMRDAIEEGELGTVLPLWKKLLGF